LASSRTRRKLAVVVLAAGKGKRMKSALPKVLHPVAGRPSLWHVLQAARAARPDVLVIVAGHGAEEVEQAVRGWNIKPPPVFVVQHQLLGTGHATAAAEQVTEGAQDVVGLAGDDPLIAAGHVRTLLGTHRRTKAAATILTTVVDDPTGYGRVVREGSELKDIVQEADASPEQRRIREVSTLAYAFRREDLYGALPLVGRENRLREYYLPDVLFILRNKGERLSAVPVDLGGALGLNSRAGLAAVNRVMRDRIVKAHMAAGVTFADPSTSFVDVDVRIGPDTVILPLTFLEGATRIGRDCSIGPATRVVDSTVADGARITFAVVHGSKIGRHATVGPYASLRPGTVLEDGAKVGTYVEVKASRVGKGSKVPHLAYVGDAVIGEGSNLGAGTVTVNYDGFEKHRTVIGDGVHVGSDTMLVAPVRLGANSWTGAGSVITKDVPPGALAVERTEQRTIAGYDERRREARKKDAGARGRATRTTSKRSRRGSD